MPVALGIKGYQLYMSCVMNGTEPVLQLEVSEGSHWIHPPRDWGFHPTLNPVSPPVGYRKLTSGRTLRARS